MSQLKVYIALTVYNYDASPRHQYIKHTCKSIEHAKHVVHRLETLKGIYIGGGRTGGWLDRHHGIYGFVDSIDGIFEQTTRRIA